MIKELLNSRMKEYNIGKQKYKVNQLIFETLITILCLIFVVTYLYYGNDTSNHLYMKCTQEKCSNPYYHSLDCGSKLPSIDKICTQELFVKGETYGTPPPPIFIYFNSLVIFGIIFCLILNHLIYNRKFKYKTFVDEINEEETKMPPIDEVTSSNIIINPKIEELKIDNIQQGEVKEMESYCMKCKKQVSVKESKEVIMKNGRKASEGKCSVCGTKVFKMMSK